MTIRRDFLRFASVIPLSLSLTRYALAGESIPAYNTYSGYPFSTAKGGLADDLIALLNRQRVPGGALVKKQMTRAKLVKEIAAEERHFAGVILFLNPRFIDDAERKRFLWSDPLFTDYNVLVFRRPPPERLDETSLRGLTFGGVLDHRMEGLDDLIEKRVVRRVTSDSEEASLKKMLKGEVDFTQMPWAMFKQPLLNSVWVPSA